MPGCHVFLVSKDYLPIRIIDKYCSVSNWINRAFTLISAKSKRLQDLDLSTLYPRDHDGCGLPTYRHLAPISLAAAG